MEHKAKNQYIKIIVSDDAPDIKAADNEQLRQVNEKKKEALKGAKSKLTETQENVQKLAPLVEEGMLANLVTEISHLVLTIRYFRLC